MTEHDLDPAFLNVDPLQSTYREAITESPELKLSVQHAHTALLCIDMQYLDAAPGFGVFADAEKSGVPPEAQAYYFDRLDTEVLPNVRRLQDAFRAHGLEVIHTRIQSLTRDGRDRGPGHKRLGLHAAPGSKEAEFIEQVAPIGDEIVINKTASGVFNATNIEYILRNMGITGLFIVGVYSNECVSTAIRDACDLGFYVTLLSDGCATVTPELQNATVTTMKDRYARVMTTAQAIAELNALVDDGHDTDCVPES
ncbi:MAG: cysteine hydrolase [Gammaproteobacteria bacterium]|nr:cysteine hydrolase [Gammaproteobacteria bacterium]MCP5136533.1 cysteine hydrolase [Gammaproteobacteria bacterium]